MQNTNHTSEYTSPYQRSREYKQSGLIVKLALGVAMCSKSVAFQSELILTTKTEA